MMKEILKVKVTTELIAKVLYNPDTNIAFAAITGEMIDSTNCAEIGINPIIHVSGEYYMMPDTYTLKRMFSTTDLEAAVCEIADEFEIIARPKFNGRNTTILKSHSHLCGFTTTGPEDSPELIAKYNKIYSDLDEVSNISSSDTIIYEVQGNMIECQKQCNSDCGYYVDYIIDDMQAVKFNI